MEPWEPLSVPLTACTCMPTCPCTHTCTHSHTCLHICACMHTCPCMHTYTQLHLHAHLYLCTHLPSLHNPICALMPHLCSRGAVACTSSGFSKQEFILSGGTWSLLTDAENPLIWPLHFRMFVMRAFLYIFSVLELTRPGTLTGSEAFYKPLKFKDSIKWVCLFKQGAGN